MNVSIPRGIELDFYYSEELRKIILRALIDARVVASARKSKKLWPNKKNRGELEFSVIYALLNQISTIDLRLFTLFLSLPLSGFLFLSHFVLFAIYNLKSFRSERNLAQNR